MSNFTKGSGGDRLWCAAPQVVMTAAAELASRSLCVREQVNRLASTNRDLRGGLGITIDSICLSAGETCKCPIFPAMIGSPG
jgi:hypothetical protein